MASSAVNTGMYGLIKVLGALRRLGSPVSGVDGAGKEQECFRFFRIFSHEGLEDLHCVVAVMVCL
jgi:hypothetical protein